MFASERLLCHKRYLNLILHLISCERYNNYRL